MPIPKSEFSISGESVTKLILRRGKKNPSADRDRAVTKSTSNTVHQGSFTSGLDFLTATASVSSKPSKKQKAQQQRLNSSLGSGLDFLTAGQSEIKSNHVESSKKKGRRNNRKSNCHDDDDNDDENDREEHSLDMSDFLGETIELDEEDSSTANTSDGGDAFSVGTMGTIADRRKQLEQELKRAGMAESDVFHGDAQEDIFTFYSWSSSRQARPKILRERNLLQDAIQQATVVDTKRRFVKTK
jgi:hypothetical protein